MTGRPAGRPPRWRSGWWVWLAAMVLVIAAGAGVVAAVNDDGATDDPPRGRVGTGGGCEYWVAVDGDDDGSGTRTAPWATLEHAAAEVPDRSCTVWVAAGTYVGNSNIKRRFTTVTMFRSEEPRRAILENDGTVLDIDGGRNIVLEGFELRHTGPETPGSDYVAIVDRRDDTWSERITFRGNIFHDSHGDDLLKIHNGVRFATVENNVFYNQGENEQHIDVNSVTDITIKSNIFFNDYAGSGRDPETAAKHFIVVKDSNEDDDGLEGSERIDIQGNVFLNWQGGSEPFVTIGNDGKPYHEARDVLVENNVLIGNSSTPADTAFGVRGARDVTFNNNTVVGDLPAKSFAYRIHLNDDNPKNSNIRFTNNIWSDPTGTMGADDEGGENEFSDGDPSAVDGLVNDTNLYWNADAPVPPGAVASPLLDDPRRIVGDPQTPVDQSDITLPRWAGDRFLSGETSIHDERTRLIEAYAAIPATSPAVDSADPETAATRDILGRVRDVPDIGAFEADDGGGS